MTVRDIAKKILPKLVTLTLVVISIVAAYALYMRYTNQPWTRDGQVRADVIKIAPRVEGYVTRVAVEDNQFVHKGDLLFEIDPSDYQLAVDKAQVKLDQSREDVEALQAMLRAAEATIKQREQSEMSAEAKVREAQAGIKSAAAVVDEAKAGVTTAQAMIAQNSALLEEARREADRAKRLADEKAGSIESAESKKAAVQASEAKLESARAGLQQAQAALTRAQVGQTQAETTLAIAETGLKEVQESVIISIANRDRAKAELGVPGEGNVRIRQAKVELDEANLKLEWTKIHAPADGYIANLYVTNGTFAVTGSPLVAQIDADSFRVHAYFQETQLQHIQPGDRAIVTLMSHSGQALNGVVDTIGRGIEPPGIASTEGQMGVIPQIEPTFDWVRLAQRVPVRIRLIDVPENIQLISGTTASVSIEPTTPSQESQ